MSKFVLLATLLFMSLNSNAGVYTDDLSRCLVEKTSAQDKNVFVKWMFTALSHHPIVQKDVSFAVKVVDESNKNMADLMVDLLSVRCLSVTKKAIKYEGLSSIESAFTVLGQVAGQELMGHSKVAESLQGFDKHIDSELLNSRLGIK